MALNKVSGLIHGHSDWHVTSLKDFDEWSKIVTRESSITVFRGQRKDYKLLPSISRNNIPQNILHHERELIDKFKKEAVPCLHLLPNSEWDWLVVAQHHGLPTRLLDWTYNIHIGLWFALDGSEKLGSNPEVWALNPEKKDIIESLEKSRPYAGSRTKLFQPKFEIPRVRAQQGCFTSFRYVQSSKNGFVPLQQNKYLRKRLTRVRIASHVAHEIKEQLAALGYTKEFLFPDIDNVAKRIKKMVMG